MGNLPIDRIEIAQPFAISGADVFGDYPVVHAGRGHQKRWVLLITCFVTRAVALYPLKDLTLSTVINALTKMNSQFPSLKKVYSVCLPSAVIFFIFSLFLLDPMSATPNNVFQVRYGFVEQGAPAPPVHSIRYTIEYCSIIHTNCIYYS